MSRRIRRLAIAAAAAVALPLAIAAVLPAHDAVTRQIVVARPATELSARVADFTTRAQWIPWQATEPTATFAAAGRPGAPGATFRWEGKRIGAGVATLTRHVPGTMVVTALRFERPMPMQATNRFTFEPLDATHTRVTWRNEGSLPYPMGRLFGLVIDRVVGADYARGLARLRAVAEGAPPALARAR